MIRELSRDLVALIHKDYPELEELNLSSNGKWIISNTLTSTFLYNSQRYQSYKTWISSAVRCLNLTCPIIRSERCQALTLP